jgi:predicted nucleic acid-binding protein
VTDLETAIPPGASLLVDTSVALAYLAGSEPTSPLAVQVFDAFVATGRNPASLSMVTVEQILVRPFRSGVSAVATAEGFLRHFADIRLIEVSYDIAREGARIRAATRLRTPDALILATALITEIDMLVTNDRAWRGAAQAIEPRLAITLLTDLVRPVG